MVRRVLGRWGRALRLLPLAGPALVLAGTAGADGPIRFPFNPVDRWYVQQGYDQGSHSGYERYALDLAHRDAAAGRIVVAPVSGTIAFVDEGFGCLGIALGRDDLHLSICHVELGGVRRRGDSIAAGTPIGTVALPGARRNGGMAHIHLALFRDPTGGRDRAQRVAVPFGPANPISSIAFPPGEEHTGKNLVGLAPGSSPAAPTASAAVYPAQAVRAGANLVAYFGPEAPPAQALAALGPGCCPVFAWDAAARRWRIYVPGAPAISDLTALKPFQAYWLIGAGAATWRPPAPDSEAPKELTVRAGANLVVYPGADTTAAGLSASLGGALTAIYAWDGEGGRWRWFLPAAPAASTLAELRQWGAYWLTASREATLPLP